MVEYRLVETGSFPRCDDQNCTKAADDHTVQLPIVFGHFSITDRIGPGITGLNQLMTLYCVEDRNMKTLGNECFELLNR